MSTRVLCIWIAIGLTTACGSKEEPRPATAPAPAPAPAPATAAAPGDGRPAGYSADVPYAPGGKYMQTDELPGGGQMIGLLYPGAPAAVKAGLVVQATGAGWTCSDTEDVTTCIRGALEFRIAAEPFEGDRTALFVTMPK